MCSYKAMKLLVPRVRPCMCMRAGNLQFSRSEEHSCTLKTLQEKCTQYQKTKMLRSRPKFMRKHFLVNFKTTLVMKESTDFSMQFSQHIFTARLCRTPRRVPSCHRVVEPNGPGDGRMYRADHLYHPWPDLTCLDEMCFFGFLKNQQQLLCLKTYLWTFCELIN